MRNTDQSGAYTLGTRAVKRLRENLASASHAVPEEELALLDGVAA